MRNPASGADFIRKSLSSCVFDEKFLYPLRLFPYCIRWFPYSVGRQPYCAGGCNKEIGAQKGCFLRPLPFVLDFEAFVGGEK